jgi:uncharacterized protein (DUF2267 family)
VALAGDQHPIGDLDADGQDEAFGEDRSISAGPDTGDLSVPPRRTGGHAGTGGGATRTGRWARVSVGEVDDREFFRSVADQAGLSREEATDLTRATLQALAQRVSAGAVRELVLHLPDRLAEQVGGVKGRPSRHSGLAEAEKQVSDRTGLRRDEVHVGFAAVLATLREALSPDVFDRVVAQLPREFRDLVPD